METTGRVLIGVSTLGDSRAGYSSLGQFCMDKLSDSGDKTIIYDAITTETLSASHLLYRSLRVTDCLRHSGIASGDCVAICCENRLEYIYVVCGSIFLGATVVLISADYTTNEIQRALDVARPKLVFGSPNTQNKVFRAVEHCSAVKKAIIFGDEFIGRQNFVGFNTYVRDSRVKKSTGFQCAPQVLSTNLAFWLFDGDNKMVQWSQLGVMSNMSEIGIAYTGPNHLMIDAWSNNFGCFLLLRSIFCGFPIVMLSSYGESLLFSAIQKFQVGVICVKENIMNLLAKGETVNEYNIGCLTTVESPCTGNDEAIKRRIQLRLPSIRYFNHVKDPDYMIYHSISNDVTSKL